ncbi:DUF3078 domain-containing protein [candidate division KSB1 bacterium]|nr:DUF3078 domain-containing protein [candidate division KSB1 bacterium]
MKSLASALIFTIFVSQSILAQDTRTEAKKYGWQKEIVGGINLTQTSFDNWAQGGENSLAWQANLNLKFINDREKTNWANSGKLSYGSLKSADQAMRKSIDEIKLESVFTYKLAKFVNPFAAATVETQFAPGYIYDDDSKRQISAFMDPGYFRESIGLNYQPNQIVNTRFGASLKQTITSQYPRPFADDPETQDKTEKFKSEIGAESVTDINWKIAENTLFTAKLELFSTFQSFDETDVNWDTILTTKMSKYFNMNFNFKLFYDKDISSKRQINQAIALGVTYSFL